MTRKLSVNRRMLAAATATLIGAGLVAGTGSPSFAASHARMPAATAPELVMESSPESSITQNFNPFLPTAAPYGMGATGLIFEPLIEFDLAAPPKYYPWLATAYAWSNGGKTITFTIRQGVKWNDGTPFTPADVVFTFNEVKKYAAINLSGIAPTSVTSSGNTVSVNFATSQYANLENIAGLAMLPQHIWGSAGNPALYTASTPVGTGPYVLDNFTPEGYTLKANPNYWGTKPQVPEVFFPVYTSNTGALTALFSGKIDWTGNFIPGLQKNFVAKNPSERGYWEAPGSTNTFEPNLNVWPTNQLAVRQAISAAINRTVIADEGEAGLENPALSATGLTLPTFAAWGGQVKSLVNSATAQPALAKSILEKAGYTLKGGFFWLGSKEVTVTLISPSAYTDYAESGSLAAQELRAAGINASFDGLTVNAWNADVASGDFSISEHWANGGLTPYNMYNGWLNSSLATGNSATGDYERLHSAKIDAELNTLQGAATTAQQVADLTPIAKFVATDVPLIPVDTASEWFEYNAQNYVGWPSQANPYSEPGPSNNQDVEFVILHLTPAS